MRAWDRVPNLSIAKIPVHKHLACIIVAPPMFSSERCTLSHRIPPVEKLRKLWTNQKHVICVIMWEPISYYMATLHLRERARWIKSYVVISYPSGRDGVILPAPAGLLAASRKKNFPESRIINLLLTKLVRSRWLDIDLVLFWGSLWTLTPLGMFDSNPWAPRIHSSVGRASHW